MGERLQPYQVIMLLYMIQIGVGIFSLPRMTAETFGTNGWIGLILISLLVTLNILLIGLVFYYGKGRSIFQIIDDNLPKFLSFLLYIAIAILWSSLAVFIAKDFELLILMLYYPTLPESVFIILALYIAYRLTRGGIIHIAKTATIFFSTILIVFILAFHIPEFSFERLTPFIFSGEKELLNGGLNLYFSFLGYELSLLFIPFMAKNNTPFKPMLYAHFLLTFIYLITCFMAYGFFSFEQLLHESFPVLSMFEYVELPFLERTENIITHFFIWEVFATVVAFFWGADQMVRQALPKLSPKVSIISLLLLSFTISLTVDIVRDVEKWIFLLRSMELLVAVTLPILLLILIGLSKIRKN
ncbi:GerAB/ArcD/ProY family transporter [Bacillus spongiae]|uniref:GerAB/ArcD/ProY family transporter n=1 Tax=Bacillus spongiae TaxID=2683610 RepID=A0ABU8HC56_9BACI